MKTSSGAGASSSLPLPRGELASLSIVIPVLNEAASLGVVLPALIAQLQAMRPRWEIVVVDDGSTDDLGRVLNELYASLSRPSLRWVHLSRNFGKEAAITAGLERARGDAVVLMDGDGQHPVELLPQMAQQWQQGYDMVYAVQQSRQHESRALRWLKARFYAFLRAGERMTIPPDAGDFRLLDRCVVSALLALPERTRFMKGLYAWVGFKSIGVPYTATERLQGATKFRLPRLFELAVTGITAFSMKPLRFVSRIGVFISLAALAYGIYIVAETVVVGNPVSGWATLAAGMMLLSGIQLVCLGVIGEYLGRVFDEVKRRPLYVVAGEVDHSQLLRRSDQPGAEPLRVEAA